MACTVLVPQLFAIQAQGNSSLTASLLRWELLKVAVAIVLLFLGAAAILLFFFREKSRESTLIYFGLFSFLYAVRLLANLQIVRLSFGYPNIFWRQFDWTVTAIIILPVELFLYQIADGLMKKFFRWQVVVQGVLSAGGILAPIFGASVAKLHFVNNIDVLATIVSGPAFYLMTRGRSGRQQPWSRELRVFLVGFSVWLLFVLYGNLQGLGILRGRDVEFLGFFVFVCSLAYITASRSFANEELLVTINKELEIARQIQSSTLPRDVPRLSGLHIAAHYVPMSAVAGDFYDFLVLDEKRVGILVADVTGHGVPAALIASMLKVAFSGQSEHAQDPARVLAGLNRALCGKFEEHFVTAVYVFVDLETGVLRYAGAGHPPLLLASAPSGKVRPVQENGLMLGLFPEATYTSAEIRLSPGDRCLLYTDGLFEAANATQEEFGKTRLEQFLQSNGDLPASRLASGLLAEVSRWSGHSTGRRQEDDITLLVLALEDS